MIIKSSNNSSRGYCLIVGEDGWDPCVLINLISFYTSLGFRVAISKTVYSADLVVIMRYSSESVLADSSLKRGTPVHIYPYVGLHPGQIVNRLARCRVSVFAPSPELMPAGVDGDCDACYPPVDISRWTQLRSTRPYRFIHIGNRKFTRTRGLWPDNDRLADALTRDDAHVWGAGWEKVAGIRHNHGPVRITEVSNLYSMATYSLGLMYPFQLKSRTISSRFWQAPLCGSALICEDSVSMVAGGVPGVYPRGVSNLDDMGHVIQGANEIARAASEYWGRKWDIHRRLVLDTLDRYPPQSGALYGLRSVLYTRLWLLARHRILYF
jgi:hypothetical protein